MMMGLRTKEMINATNPMGKGGCSFFTGFKYIISIQYPFKKMVVGIFMFYRYNEMLSKYIWDLHKEIESCSITPGYEQNTQDKKGHKNTCNCCHHFVKLMQSSKQMSSQFFMGVLICVTMSSHNAHLSYKLMKLIGFGMWWMFHNLFVQRC